jgi:hypothetical protein
MVASISPPTRHSAPMAVPAANPGMRVDAGPAADPDRAIEADEGADLGAGINHDRPVPHDDLLRDRCAVGGEETGPNLAEAS